MRIRFTCLSNPRLARLVFWELVLLKTLPNTANTQTPFLAQAFVKSKWIIFLFDVFVCHHCSTMMLAAIDDFATSYRQVIVIAQIERAIDPILTIPSSSLGLEQLLMLNALEILILSSLGSIKYIHKFSIASWTQLWLLLGCITLNEDWTLQLLRPLLTIL